MKITVVILLVGFVISSRADDQTNLDSSTNTMETIVCVRHGEKPPGGLGQLSCRGLNRSLALPNVLLKKFGKPEFIFAPNPTQKVDRSPGYYYVRPLATIEPTAILCGLPINAEFGYRQIKGLEDELDKPQYQNATVFVAWEHGLLDEFAKNMLKDNGDNLKKVPYWQNSEYDMIFVFKIKRENGQKQFSFTIDHEGLNGLKDTYPESANHS